jgi:CubicO group peptidase (beta-lactamase class C family)
MRVRVQANRVTAVAAAASILAGACTSLPASSNPQDSAVQPDTPADASYFPPPDSQGGWRSVQAANDVRRVAGMDRDQLDDAFEFIKGSSRNGGLLAVRRGWLVYERYFGKGHREATPNLASCGKSVTSIALGILLAERADLFPDGMEQKIFTPRYLPANAFPLTDPRKSEIKLGQLLAMTACIRGNNPVYVRGTPSTIDPAGPDGWQAGVDAVALGKEDAGEGTNRTTTATLWCNPGEGYSYATSSIHLAGMALQHVTGQALNEYVDDRLSRPLGWGRWGFGYRGAGQLTRMSGGAGIALRATDMLRFGYLLLREGRWDGRQIVPAEYVRHASRRSPYNPHYPYSLQFSVNTGGEIPELPRDAFWKAGSGGHALYVVPSLDLVVWKLGGRDDQYSPGNTRMTPHPDAARNAEPREGWKQTVDNETALRRTLQLVVASRVRGVRP